MMTNKTEERMTRNLCVVSLCSAEMGGGLAAEASGVYPKDTTPSIELGKQTACHRSQRRAQRYPHGGVADELAPLRPGYEVGHGGVAERDGGAAAKALQATEDHEGGIAVLQRQADVCDDI